MISSFAKWLEKRYDLHYERTTIRLTRLVVTSAAALFILASTAIIASEDILASQRQIASLGIGDIAPDDIFASQTVTYTSDVLTEQNREAARAGARVIFEPPDPDVARRQTELARQILDYVNNIRAADFEERSQKIQDIAQITALDLDEVTINQILDIDEERWATVDNEIITVLERVMRGQIQETDLARIRDQLPTQVSVRFDEREVAVIVAIVTDLVRSNTSLNEEATTAEQDAAEAAVPIATRSFERGQLVIAGGQRLEAADYEALAQLGVLQPEERRWQSIGQALLASIVVMVVVGLYLARFRPSLLYNEPRALTLLSVIFLIALAGARLGTAGQIFIYPSAAMALIYVAISGPEIAVIGMLALALLIGIMADNSLEITTLVVVGGLIGALTLRRAERLNSFFIAGLMVAVGNAAVITLFNLASPVNNPTELTVNLVYVMLNGVLAAAAALAGLYVLTLVFNLPTALKLAELSQPNQPLLQRLLREAPGTYQHSLQVANLAEQAANAIGANSQLTHVAALYHDIGKMLNPAFFVENQRYTGNPHDTLNDPYRSADIIISHITGGDEVAKQYRLPTRFRQFIREHHGTTTVYVFYHQAVILAGDDESMVDIADFTYPGPKPQSRETGILMLADSCEAAVRASQPKSKQEIENIIHSVVDGKRMDGQLDDSGLTLRDLKITQEIFVDMMQAIFHPRINYTEAIAKVRRPTAETEKPALQTSENYKKRESESTQDIKKIDQTAAAAQRADTPPAIRPVQVTSEAPIVIREDEDNEDTPLSEVPRLRKTSENEQENQDTNGVEAPETSDKQVND